MSKAKQVKRVGLEGETSLVIGDAHRQPGQDLGHFEALSRWLQRRPVNRIVIIGDWVDMASLSRFDIAGSKAMEGMRIEKDITSGVQALQALLKGLPRTELIFIEGNHEERIKRMEEEHPKLVGSFAFAERMQEAAGEHRFAYVGYRNYYIHPTGLAFTHVPHNSIKPIESTSGARKVLGLSAGSVVWGHTHQLDFATLKRNGGEQICGLNVGCFIRPEHDPDYMKGRIKDWWRGVVLVKHNKGRWRGEFETISLATLRSF